MKKIRAITNHRVKTPGGRMLVLFFALIFAAAAGGIGAAQEDEIPNTFDISTIDSIAKWIAGQGYPLKSVNAGSGFDDLQPLKKILRGVRIVGLGEATHGTREFFQCKHRLLEFLVKEMDFQVFAIEASYPACLKINDYVLHGKGNRDEVLAGQGFWTWNTEEVAAMIDWMKDYNSSLPDENKIKFLGYDIQNIGLAIELITSFIEKADPDYLPAAEKAFEIFKDGRERMRWPEKPEEEKEANKSKLRDLIGFLSFNHIRFQRTNTEKEIELALQHARVLLQLYNAYSLERTPEAREKGRFLNRDYYMAENIQHLISREKPGTKVVVWAHNGHIFKGDEFATGSYLNEIYGDQYYALGFVFNQGSFQAINGNRESERRGLVDFTFGPSPEGYLGWIFKKAGIGDLYIDFRTADKSHEAVSAFLNATIPMRSLGSMYSEKWPAKYYSRPTVLGTYYDGMIFIDSTTRARPQPIGPGSSKK